MIITPLSVVEALTEVLVGLVLLLILGAVAARALRHRAVARRLRTQAVARPIILRALDAPVDGELPRQLPRSVAVELEAIATTMVTWLRGADQDALVDLLRRQGRIDAARQRSRSRRPMTRLRAVELLGAVGAPESLPELLARLDDRNLDVRRAAVRAVGRAGGPDVVPHLLQLIERPDRGVAQHSVTLALLRLGPAAAPALIRAVADGEVGPEGRRAAANVLGWLGHPGAVETLCAALDERPDDLRAAALDALGRIGVPSAGQAVAARLTADHPVEIRVAAARALGRLGDPAAAPGLCLLLAEEHDVARAAADALAQLGEAGHERLREALGSAPEARERLAVVAAGAGARSEVPQGGPGESEAG